MRKLVGLLVLGMMACPAWAGTIATPYVAGSHQGWNPGSDPMTETFAGSDVWQKSYAGLTPGGRYEYKVTNGTWDQNLPAPGNSWFYADGAGNITITYDGNTYADGWSPTLDRFGLSTDPGTWTAVGDWQSQVGGGNWDNANPFTSMTSLGGGIYDFIATLTPGNYNWKAVVTGTSSWDAISWDCRSVNSSNWGFTTDATNNTVRFVVDSYTGVAKTLVVPEPSALALLAFGGLALLRRR